MTLGSRAHPAVTPNKDCLLLPAVPADDDHLPATADNHILHLVELVGDHSGSGNLRRKAAAWQIQQICYIQEALAAVLFLMGHSWCVIAPVSTDCCSKVSCVVPKKALNHHWITVAWIG